MTLRFQSRIPERIVTSLKEIRSRSRSRWQMTSVAGVEDPFVIL